MAKIPLDKIANIKGELKANKKFIPLAVLLLGLVIYLAWPSNESIYVGTIEVTEVDVAPRVSSQIAERVRDEGDFVKAGDVLYKLTCEEQLADAEKSDNDFEGKKTPNIRNMSPEQYDSFKRNYEINRLRVEWCTIKSPMDGVLLTKFHEAGDWVSPGTKLMAMGDLDDVWAYVYVDQPMLASLSIGQNVTGYLPELKMKPIAGTIIHIKDEAEFTPKNVQTRMERTRLVYGAKVRFDNTEKLLKPGMPIEVRFKKLKK